MSAKNKIYTKADIEKVMTERNLNDLGTTVPVQHDSSDPSDDDVAEDLNFGIVSMAIKGEGPILSQRIKFPGCEVDIRRSQDEIYSVVVVDENDKPLRIKGLTNKDGHLLGTTDARLTHTGEIDRVLRALRNLSLHEINNPTPPHATRPDRL